MSFFWKHIFKIVAFIAVALIFLSLSKRYNNSDLKELKNINDSLISVNLILEKSNKSIDDSLVEYSIKIESLNKKDDLLKQKVVKLNGKIEILKNEYEKANNHANNFNSLDIQRYFSELQ